MLPTSANTPFFGKARTKLGIMPMTLPPVFPPCVVADALPYAAERAPWDLVVGGAGKAMLLSQRLSPHLMEAIMGPVGYRWQRGEGPKPEGAPDYRTPHEPGSRSLARSPRQRGDQERSVVGK